MVVHDAKFPYMPALHVQTSKDEFKLGELELEGHVVHAALPVADLKVPAAQAVHVFPEGHVVSVRSTPVVIAFAISVVASAVSNSSTMKAPATSAFKCPPPSFALPKYIASKFMSP